MKETEINKVLNYMKQYVENKYEHDSEPMLTYKDLKLVLDEIDRLSAIIEDKDMEIAILKEELENKKKECENLIEEINPYRRYGVNKSDFH